MFESNPQAQQVSGNFDWNSLASSSYGIVGDLINYGINSASQSRQNAFSSSMQARAHAYSRESQREAENYNSARGQVSRLKEAGLSPAIMYGSGLQQSVTAQSGTTSTVPDYAKLTLRGIEAAQLAEQSRINNASVANLMSDTGKKHAEEDYQRIVNSNQGIRQYIENSKLLKELELMESQKDLTNEQRQNIADLRENINKLNEALAKQASASADYTSGALTDKTKADERVSDSTVPVLESEKKLNDAKTKTEGTQQDLNKAKTTTEDYQQKLMQSEARKINIDADTLAQQLQIDSAQYRLIKNFCEKYDLPRGSEKAIMLALEDFAKSSGTTVPKLAGDVLGSWLDAGNWLPFISQQNRTASWSKPQNGSDEKPLSGSPQTDSKPQGSLPQTESYSPDQREYIHKQYNLYNQFDNWDKHNIEEYSKSHTQLETAKQIERIYHKKYSNKNNR